MANGIRSIFRCSKSPMIESPVVVIEVDLSVLLLRLSFLRSYFCRCDEALAFSSCKTSVELELSSGLGGKELIVTSIPTVLEVHPWVGRGGDAG